MSERAKEQKSILECMLTGNNSLLIRAKYLEDRGGKCMRFAKIDYEPSNKRRICAFSFIEKEVEREERPRELRALYKCQLPESFSKMPNT